MISPTILKCLGQLLQDKIEYLTKITHNGTSYKIVIGSTQIFLLDDDFDKIKCRIPYCQIARIIVSILNINLFQMHMNENKSENVPAKMNIHTLDRRQLVNKIRFAWKTNFMYNHLEVRDMPVYKAEFADTLFSDTTLPVGYIFYQIYQKGPSLALMELQTSQGYQKHYYKDYTFFLPIVQQFKTIYLEQEGVYYHSQENMGKIIVQITEEQPIEILSFIGVRQVQNQEVQDRIDLQYYAETYMEQILISESREIENQSNKNQVKDDEEDEENAEKQQNIKNKQSQLVKNNQVNDYWILSSGVYSKRENLNTDPSEWKGWEIHARTAKKDVYLIFLRRKYLPPLMENYAELVFILFGPDDFKSLQEEKVIEIEDEQQQEEDQEEEEEEDDEHKSKRKSKKPNSVKNNKKEEDEKDDDDGDGLKFAYETLATEQFMPDLLRNSIDTIQTTRNVLEIYTKLIKNHANCLMYDEETLKFYQLRLSIEPFYISFGICFLQKFLRYYADKLGESNSQKSIQFDFHKFNQQAAEIDQIYQSEKQENNDKLPNNIPDKPKDFKAIIDLLEAQSFQIFIKDKKKIIDHGEKLRIWNYKFSRYMAYCFDGGLMGTKFNLKCIIELLNVGNLPTPLRTELMELLDYFLYAIPDTTGEATEFVKGGDLTKRLQKMVIQRYVFNEQIMISLLESEFFSNEFLKKDYSQLYSDILVYLLLNSKNSTLKIAVCKHIVQFHATAKGSWSESINNACKALISPLLMIYQSPNKKLSSLACVGLFNMCTNSKEYKYIIIKENGAEYMIQRLITKDQNLLYFTLKLIHSMMSIVQNIERFIQLGLTQRLQVILSGVGIPKCCYSAKTMIITCQILRVCFASEEINVHDEDTYIDLFVHLVTKLADQYQIEQKEIHTLKAEAIYALSKLCVKYADVRKKTEEKIVKSLLDLLVAPIHPNLAEKIIFFLCIIIKGAPEVRTEWLKYQPGLIEVMEYYEDQKLASSNYLLLQLQQEMKIQNQKS